MMMMMMMTILRQFAFCLSSVLPEGKIFKKLPPANDEIYKDPVFPELVMRLSDISSFDEKPSPWQRTVFFQNRKAYFSKLFIEEPAIFSLLQLSHCVVTFRHTYILDFSLWGVLLKIISVQTSWLQLLFFTHREHERPMWVKQSIGLAQLTEKEKALASSWMGQQAICQHTSAYI